MSVFEMRFRPPGGARLVTLPVIAPNWYAAMCVVWRTYGDAVEGLSARPLRSPAARRA